MRELKKKLSPGKLLRKAEPLTEGQAKSHKIWYKQLKYWWVHVLLLIGGLIFLYPLLFSILAGFYSALEFATSRLSLLPWPKHPTLINFKIFFAYSSEIFRIDPKNPAVHMLSRSEYAKYASIYLMNSVLRSSYATFFAVVTSLLGGYAFGRLRWPGRDKIFLFLLALQMVPPVVAFLPTYLMLYRWPLAGGNNIWGVGGHGLYNSYWVYFYGFCAMNVMGTFLVRQALLRSPVELEEAARIDGAGTFRIIFTLLAPLQKPVLAYVALTTVIGTWNDWLVPNFYIQDNRFLTLPGGLLRLTSLFSTMMDIPNYPLIITFGLVITLPCLILFAFFQRYMVEGLAHTGIKG